MVDAIVRFYKWSPVIANTLLAGLVVLVFVVIDVLGGPSIDYKWLLTVLGLGQVPINYKSVTPNSRVPNVPQDPH